MTEHSMSNMVNTSLYKYVLDPIYFVICYSFQLLSKCFGYNKYFPTDHSRIVWTNHPIPLGKVDSIINPSTSAPSLEYQSDFESREDTFMKALKALEPDHKSNGLIALCGMGGVGKTTMMEKLKTVVKEKRMFSLIVKAVIGEKTDPFAIQHAVADYLAINLKEGTVSARADKLRTWFKSYSEGGTKRILVILDDIWQFVDLNDIGLSPLPNQDVDFKILLTSRSRDVCTIMGVEANSIFDVNVLAKAEAQTFFWQFIKDSDLDPDFRKVGDDIVRRCQGLPIAIKTIAYTLKSKSKGVWEDTLTRLQHHDIDEIMNEVFGLSYKNLEDEQTKSVLLLCGLYPEDFDIPTEELVWYGWGLKLFNKVYTIKQARNRLNSCILRLLNTNLLITSNCVGCIKMHDLVRAFVLKLLYSKGNSIVNHDNNMSEWPANDAPESCNRISLACKGMEEFPRDFKYPNLSFLKLTHGDKSLKFPENFYGLMEKLQVIVYEKMHYPLLPRSFEYSTNLRTLCLHDCSLMFDCHSIGSLLKLEVLSFANCSIQKLSSTIGNLKELKLLDLTGCVNLRIDEGVLKKLVKLEELYMRVAREKAISFTDGNFNEFVERSKSLSALEVELFRNNAHPNKMSFINLERFKISIGCFLEKKDEKTTSFENTLMLVSNKGELLESRINELFEKTVVLHLQVDDMYDLEDFKVKSLRSIECSSFYKLRVLNISKCAQLRYIFTRRVAATLLKLEHLEVLSCNIMQTLIHDDEDSGSEPIKFPSLKFLSLAGLPKLVGLCNTRSVIELPQLMELRLDGLVDFTSIFPADNLASLSSSSMSSDTFTEQHFLNEQVAIPKLETLQIRRMNKLNKIWSSEVVTSGENFKLKRITVVECDRLVNLFPRNPMPLLHNLKEISVKKCRSIKTIFKIDMICFPQGSSSDLVSIVVEKSENLRHVWSLINVAHLSNNRIIHVFEAVETIKISHCVNFRNIFTPITLSFNLEALQQFDIGYGNSSPEQQNSRDIALSSHLIRTFRQLRTLCLREDRHSQVVFDDIESVCLENRGKLSTSENNHLLPSLEDVSLSDMSNMSHVWKCNWNLQQPKSLCQNLTKISVNKCRSIKYLFSPLMFNFLSNLKHVNIDHCEVMEEIVSNRDEEMAASLSTTTHKSSMILERLNLRYLESLQKIGGGSCTSTDNQVQQSENEVGLWSLCQYSRHILIRNCSALSIAIPSYALGHMQNLEELSIAFCESMKDVFEVKSVNDVVTSEGNGGENNNSSSIVSLTTTLIVPDLGNLRRLDIFMCHLLRDVFPFATLKSLAHLAYLRIENCDNIQVIVKEEEDGNIHTTSSDDEVVVFRCLKSLELIRLPNLESFFLGMSDFQWPLLDSVEIKNCPKMTMFTQGHSDSPRLKYLNSDIGENRVECGLNNFFHATGALQEEIPYISLDGSSSVPAISERMPWFYSNLIKVHVCERWDRRFILGHNELQHMQKSEILKITLCPGIREIFQTFEMSNSVVEVREMDFSRLDVEWLWKTKQWTVLKFPYLTRLSIATCYGLKHVFTISMVASLLQLQELHISLCPEMEAVVILEDIVENEEEERDDDDKRVNEDKEDEDERRSVIEVEFPCLRSLTLQNLENLKGFCLGMEKIHWPSLEILEITKCRDITTFTNGQSTTPKLKFINTSFGLCEATEDINSFIRTNLAEYGIEFVGV